MSGTTSAVGRRGVMLLGAGPEPAPFPPGKRARNRRRNKVARASRKANRR